MGLFDFVKKIGGEVLGSVIGVTTLLTGSKPKEAIKTGVAVSKDPVVQKLGTIPVIATALVAGGALATNPVTSSAIVSAVSKTASTVGKTFVAHPISTAAGVLVGVPLVAGVISKKPELVTSLPSKAFSTGQGLVDVIEEHPVASGIVGGVTGGTLLYEGYKYLTGEKDVNVEIPTVALPKEIPSVVAPEEDGISVIDKSGQMNTQPYNPTTEPITPKTEKVSSSGTVRRRKRKSKSSVPTSINQRVNVIVSNKSSSVGIKQNKNYLRERLLYN